jgi:hypothetical protein
MNRSRSCGKEITSITISSNFLFTSPIRWSDLLDNSRWIVDLFSDPPATYGLSLFKLFLHCVNSISCNKSPICIICFYSLTKHWPIQSAVFYTPFVKLFWAVFEFCFSKICTKMTLFYSVFYLQVNSYFHSYGIISQVFPWISWYFFTGNQFIRFGNKSSLIYFLQFVLSCTHWW